MAHRRVATPPAQVRIARHIVHGLLLCTLALAAAPQALQAQAGTLAGRIVDAITGEGVPGAEIEIAGAGRATVSDTSGRFHVTDLQPGVLVLSVRHIAYGRSAIELTVLADVITEVRLELSQSAVVLAPLDVGAVSAAARELRGMGYRHNLVTRAQLAQARGTGLTFGEVLRQFVPGVRVRTVEGVVGAATCIELRAAARASNRCQSPAVYVDGVPITNVASIYAAFPLEMVESIEVVPAAEAGGRFGVGALYGALLIESRRPGARNAAERARDVPSPFHDWSAEERGHTTLRAFAAAAAGNGAGLAGGFAIATSCIGTRAPSHDRLVSSCDALATLGATAAAIVIPAVGGALGSGLGGRSGASSGRLLPAAVGAAMALVPGYALLLTGQRMDSDVLRGAGVATLVIGSPFLSAMADHQFRRVHRAADAGRD